jgi:hypothetical protein
MESGEASKVDKYLPTNQERRGGQKSKKIDDIFY